MKRPVSFVASGGHIMRMEVNMIARTNQTMEMEMVTETT
jgi:hypothetical protein